MSLSESIAVLAATPPPRSKPIFNVNKCNERIFVLSAELGLPAKEFYSAGKANAYIKELQSKLAAAAAPVAQAQSAAPLAKFAHVATPLQANATGDTISPATLTALCQAIYGTDAETSFEGQRQQLTRSGLAVPGLAPAPENPNYTVKFVGFARSIRADRMAKIASFFTPKTH